MKTGLPIDCRGMLHSKLPRGVRNLITDVPGVTVGNVTLRDGKINTGVTALLPHGGNLFLDKVMAAAEVVNGFGKSVGLIQIEEMGTIETPIILTNTFSVGTALTAVTKRMMEQNPDIGRTTGTVNCVVTECNDGRLNDIRGMYVREEDVLQAVNSADVVFKEGAVGGGTGMCCLGFKGGIGSSSRCFVADGKTYTIGALVMSNFGEPGNLTIGGKNIGSPEIVAEDAFMRKDKGSIIIVIATDLPLSERQLKRVCRRTPISLGRCGSILGNGSGDVAIAFTTANRLPHYSEKKILDVKMVMDEEIDIVFQGAVEAAEEAIISSLYHADTVSGMDGRTSYSLRQFMQM